MSEIENGSAQVQTPEVPPAATGPNVAELQAQLAAEKARLAELERQSEGRLRDLQNERSKRQELEQRLSSPASPAAPSAQSGEIDEIYNVVAPAIEKHPVVRQLIADREASIQEKAQQFLETKTGKKFTDLQKDLAFQEKLTQAVNKYGTGKDLYETTVKAFENMQRDAELEEYRAQKAELARAKAASEQGSLPPGAPPASVSGVREYSAAEFHKLPTAEFDRLYASGSIRKVGDKIVYTPAK